MSYDNLAQAWTPSKNSTTQHIPKPANASWMYIHHPTSWSLEYIEGKKEKKPIFLPKLARMVLKAGVNGVGGTSDRPQTQLARIQATDRGNIIIDPNEHDYLRIYPAIGGNLTLSKFQKVENLGGKIFISGDDKAFAEFRKSLVAKGTIAIPHEQIIAGIIRKQYDIINMHNSKPHIPAAVKEASQAEQKLADMNQALEELKKNGLKCYE